MQTTEPVSGTTRKRPQVFWLAICFFLGIAIAIIVSPYVTLLLMRSARTMLEWRCPRIAGIVGASILWSLPDLICVALAATAANYWLTARMQFRWWGEVVALGAIVSVVIVLLQILQLPVPEAPMSYTFFLKGMIQSIIAYIVGGLAGGQFGRWLRARKRAPATPAA